jgi:uncharacterized protein
MSNIYYSKYNLVFEINNKRKKEYLIFNSLSGEIDLIDKKTLDFLRNENNVKIDSKLYNRFKEKKIIYENEKEENKTLQEKYKHFREIRSKLPRIYDIIVTYSCNLRCTYCYHESPYYKGDNRKKPDIIDNKTLEKAFLTIEKWNENNPSKPHIFLTGGEPLIFREKQVDIINKIINHCKKNKYHLKIATNGIDLEKYCNLLSTYEDIYIDITLDGSKKIHDRRRKFSNGKGSFDIITKGVQKALDKGLNVIVHINLDKENIGTITDLVKFFIEKKWDKYSNFVAYPGKVYDVEQWYKQDLETPEILKELFRLYEEDKRNKIISIETWSEFAKMDLCPIMFKLEELYISQFFNSNNKKNKIQNPEWLKNKKIENKKIPKKRPYIPRFNYCGACNPNFSLDLFGDIYLCGAFIGREDYRIGKYYPEYKLNEELLNKRLNRDIMNITKCKECKYSLVCGGGCSIASLHQNKDLYVPICDPIEKTLQTAFQYYYPILKELIIDEKGS